MDELAVIWRILNIVGSLIAIPAVYATVIRNRGVLSRRAQSLVHALLLAHVGILVASLEALYYGHGLGARVAIFSAVVGWTLIALFFPKVITRAEEHNLSS